jgi:hypothetical protein
MRDSPAPTTNGLYIVGKQKREVGQTAHLSFSASLFQLGLDDGSDRIEALLHLSWPGLSLPPRLIGGTASPRPTNGEFNLPGPILLGLVGRRLHSGCSSREAASTRRTAVAALRHEEVYDHDKIVAHRNGGLCSTGDVRRKCRCAEGARPHGKARTGSTARNSRINCAVVDAQRRPLS